MPVAGDPVQVGQLVRHYRIVRELGRGGFGVVFMATDENLKRSVAIKFLLSKDKRDNERFFREAIASTRVEHPSIVQVMEFGKTDDGYPFIVMEFVKGRVLTDILREAQQKQGKLGIDGLSIGWQIAVVLAETHERGIIHRDLKPPNIMLVTDSMVPGGQRVKILDFGIAKILPQAVGDDPHGLIGSPTAKGEHPGTPAFMAPEQWKTHANKDGKIDVYSLGCILYLFFAGRLPFESNNPYALLMMHVGEKPDPLDKHAPGTPPEVVELVHAMLAKETPERPTMAAVRDRIAEMLGLQPISGPKIRIRPSTEISKLLAQVPASSVANDAEADEALAPTQDGPIPDGDAAPAAKPESAEPINARSTDPKRSAGTPIPVPGTVADSLSRTPGQQVTSPDTKAWRKRRRTLLAVGIGLTVVVVGGAVGARFAFKPTPRLTPVSVSPASMSSAVPSTPVAAPTAPPVPTTELVAPAAPLLETATKSKTHPSTGAPVTAPLVTHPTKLKPACTQIPITEECIAGSLSSPQKRAFMSALDAADVTLCTGDHMTVVAKPNLEVTSAIGVRRNKQEQFVLALKGTLKKIAFPGQVEIRCKGR